jgi:hypothetical protein
MVAPQHCWQLRGEFFRDISEQLVQDPVTGQVHSMHAYDSAEGEVLHDLLELLNAAFGVSDVPAPWCAVCYSCLALGGSPRVFKMILKTADSYYPSAISHPPS